MERDFLGLNSIDSSAATVKREISDEENQLAFMKKFSSFPHFAPFRAEPIKLDETQNFSLSLSNMKPSSMSFGQNVADAIPRQQFEGVPIPKAVSIPIGQVVGFTEPWNSSKSSAAPPQMTIFYGGTVSVYEGISPEKAQAIMLLAGNGSFLGSNKNPPSPHMQSPTTNAPLTVSPSKDEQVVAKTTEISSSSANKPQIQKAVPSKGPVAMSSITPSAVPQSRKASLARFLEKRKERVMNSGPYTCKKKQTDGVIPANDNSVGSAMPSAANSWTSSAAAKRS